MRKREENFDLLRIICAVAVVMIHVSGSWVNGAIDGIAEHTLHMEELLSPFWICFYNSVSRFAVPCFVMLSGAFLLDRQENIEYKTFYRKAFAKIGIPTIVFSILYILYNVPSCFVGEERGVWILLKNIMTGEPMYHMWYLYMLIGLYALTPIVLRFKDSVSEESFYKISIVFLIWASVSNWTSMTRVAWDVGRSFEYLGYFMMGYCIRKRCTHRNNGKAVCIILLGILLEAGYFSMVYGHIMAGVADADMKFDITNLGNLMIVPASVLVFYGFALLGVRRNCAKLSGLTFWIYLIHAGVWDFICKGIHLSWGVDFFVKTDGTIWIPLFTALVFALSYVLSLLYLCLWKKADREERITKRLLKMVHM